MASVEVTWLFSKDVAPACYFVAPHLPPPYRSASGIGYASKNYLSKMVGNPASYPVHSRYSELL